jgi:hypothetical protein
MKPVSISGRVVDAEGNTVPDVEICISWERPIYITHGKDEVKREWVKSDAKGFWQIAVGKADSMHIISARKAGYQYVPGSEAGKNFSEVRSENAASVILKLRKNGETTFLIRRDQVQIIRATSPYSQTNDVDLLKERRSEPVRNVDFKVVANYVPAKNIWSMTYCAANGADGIIVGEECLNKAPEEGYQQTITINKPPYPKYLYLRSRSPTVYSRLEMDYVEGKPTATNSIMCVLCKGWINPYGDRNLEYDNRLEASWRVVDELNAEAKQAFDVKKLPQKPDIPQRIMAMNEQVAREKEASDRRHNDWLEQQKRQKEGKAE